MPANIHDLTARRDALLEQGRVITMEREVAQLETLLGLHTERTLLMESAYASAQYLTPQQIQREIGWDAGAATQFISRGDDYLHGQCKPFYQNEYDLQVIRGLGRYLEGAQEIAATVLKNLRNYTIGKGAVVTVAPKKGKGGEAVAPLVQDFVDQFLDANDYTNCGESRTLLESVSDGEQLLWLQPRGDGAPELVRIGGEQITEPLNARQIEDYHGLCGCSWSFGVATQEYRYDKVYGYFVDWFRRSGENWDFVPAGEAVHVKRNVREICKRGISDFLLPFKRIERAAKLADYIGRGAIIQASIAGIKKVDPQATQSGLNSALVGKVMGGEAAAFTADGRQVSVPGETVLGGRMIVTSNDYMHGPMGSPQGPVFAEVYQLLARIVGGRWCMPEYMVTSDASNANYASTLVAGTPFMNEIAFEQSNQAKSEEELLWKAVAMVAPTGRFAGLSAVDLYACLEIKVEFPKPENVDEEAKEQIRDSQQAAGILSAKTRASQSGLDYEQELANGAQKEQRDPLGSLGFMRPGTGGRQFGGVTPRMEALAEHALAKLAEGVRE